jgi:2-polyprenyl-6-hydroxyphenyl methylase/3-demethylubiquinone-9 3-methyltransferase
MISGALTGDPARFAFGDNWRRFLDQLDETRIVEAEKSLDRLLDGKRLKGMRFLDIGSGSGLFSLAARRLGARVHSFDFDPASVECARILRDAYFANDSDWSIEQGSILDRSYSQKLGLFDVVYSWGVLHHTGAMHDAIRNAAALVSPGGLFVFALYRKTRLCRLWTLEKRWYAQASAPAQAAACAIFKGLYRVDLALRGKDFAELVTSYQSNRGMDFERDLHDWMGGYPYESIAPEDADALMTGLGFQHIRSFTQPYSTGFFGSGCDEYVYRRSPST